MRNAKLLQTMRKCELGFLVRVPRKRPERSEPMPAELRACCSDHHERGHSEAEVADLPPLRPSLEPTQGQKDDRDPFDEDRGHPGDTGPLTPAGRAEREG